VFLKTLIILDNTKTPNRIKIIQNLSLLGNSPSLSNIDTSSNDAYFTKSSIEYPRYAKIPFLPSIEEIEDSVAN
jgi:hypothetical protein